MTNTRQHGETEAPARGIEAVVQDGLEWVQRNARRMAILVAGLVAIGTAVAVAYELDRRRESEAQLALFLIEDGFARGMGSSVQEPLIPEPANQEQAERARETALEELERFTEEHAGSEVLVVAQIRAAEMETDLRRFDAANVRLQRLIEGMDDLDPRKGIALWLSGYVLEELDQAEEAAAAYEAAGRLEGFPPRSRAWLAAGRTYTRAGRNADAARAYGEAMKADIELRGNPDLRREISGLEALVRSEEASPGP